MTALRGLFHPNRLALIAAWCSLVFFAGCKSADSGSPSRSTASASGGSSSTGSAARDRATGGSMDDPQVQAQVEERYIIGPSAARDLDYRVAWQFPQGGDPIKRFDVVGDSVFTLDNNNVLVRLRREDGSRLWRVAVAKEIEEIIGLNYIGEKIYLTTGGSILVLDAATGAQTSRQRLEKIANTQPVQHDRYLIYGSRDGQVIWHTYMVGYQWRGYQVAHSILVPPLLVDNFLIAAGNDGSLIVLNPSTANQYWGKMMLDEITARPAGGNGALYVAGLDQHLRAFDLGTGRTLWKVLTESPLTESPVLIGDRVYQQVPSEGLVCYEALPADSPGGKVVWKSGQTRGSVILRRRDNLFVWDAPARNMTLLDAAHGTVVRTMKLPKARFLTVPGDISQDVCAAGDDGRVVRLVPRN